MIRVFNHYLSTRTLLLLLIEAVVLFQAMLLGYQFNAADLASPLPLLDAALFTSAMLLSMTALGLYEQTSEQFRSMFQRLILAYGLALLVMSVIFYLAPDTYVGRGGPAKVS